ncbi:MAG TPA: hypothetical protein DCE33_07075 [Rhodospirillaceae bacterium]|nr:hypothetical protein [Rhodospirillaceae bacterium]
MTIPRPPKVLSRKFVRLAAVALFAGVFASACEIGPDGQLTFAVDPALFGGSAPAEIEKKDAKATVDMPTAITLGISKLDENGAKEFKGQKAESLVRVIGRPDFVRRDGPAQIWQYRSSACILDLFVYGKQSEQKIAHSELRGSAVGKAPANGCFAKLLEGRIGSKHALRSIKASSL